VSAKRETPMLIYKNTFSNNFAYFGTNSLFMRMYGWTAEDAFNKLSEGDKIKTCGFVSIVKNKFVNNHASPVYGQSTVDYECLPISFFYFVFGKLPSISANDTFSPVDFRFDIYSTNASAYTN
jgi:hypothetical protein